MMDDILLEEVYNEIAAQPIEAEDGVGYITSVRVTTAWNNFSKHSPMTCLLITLLPMRNKKCS
jgi:hypothetical protein